MSRIAVVSTLAATLALSACGQAPEPAAPAAVPAAPAAPASMVTSRQIMLGLVIPGADVVWAAANEAPADDAAWEKIAATAAMIAEAGALMQTGIRVVDQGDWLAYAKAMSDAATTAAQAAAAKNIDQLNDAGNALYETCDTCHRKYMAARAGQ